MSFDSQPNSSNIDRLHQALFAANRNLLYRQGAGRSRTGRYQELDGARSRGLPVLEGSGNRSVCHLPE